MRMRALAALLPLGLAACGPTTKSTTPVRSDVPERGAAPACPANEELVERARAAWALDPTEPVEITACAPGHFGEDGWLVEAFVRIGGGDGGGGEGEGEGVEVGYEQWHSILGASAFDHVVVRGSATEVPPWYVDMGGGQWSAHDLDGDGVDELLGVTSYDHHGYIVESMAVFRVADAQLQPLGTLALTYDNAAAAEDEASTIDCSAEHRVEAASADAAAAAGAGAARGRQIVIDGKHAGAADAAAGVHECPRPGIHRYGLVDGALVELAPLVLRRSDLER